MKVIDKYQKALARQDTLRTTQVILRISPGEKAEMRKAAKSLNRTLSEYIIRLHRIAIGKIEIG